MATVPRKPAAVSSGSPVRACSATISFITAPLPTWL